MTKSTPSPADPAGTRPPPASDGTNLARPPAGSELPLPHERDEAPDAADAPAGPREEIRQAGRDVARGLRDTERRGVPSDVPGPGPSPEHSPGADVPDDAPAGRGRGAHK